MVIILFLACLPSGVYDTTSAAVVVSSLKSTFPNIQCGLLVGIGGGVPSEVADIRLGEVMVSKPIGDSCGVVQYDFGNAVSGGRFQPTGTMNQPPTLLLTAVSQLEANEMTGGFERVSQTILKALNQHPEMENRFSKPPAEEDYLYHPTYDHPDSSVSCSNCDTKMRATRVSRTSEEPQIHYGTIASGNRVIKDGRYRDQIAQELNALCFEMEAAGIMNHLPCLVIRGICDYCDSHKNKKWQGYAALAAAAYAKLLLSVTPVNEALDSQHLRKACWIMPFEQNSRFIGRESEIRLLENQILATAKSSSQKAAIAGLGEVGKTQIALELAYRIREQDPRYSTFWIQSTSVEAIEQSFMTISMALRLQVAASDVKSQVRAALSLESAGPWLLITDNADDMDMWMCSQNSSPALKTFLPRCQSGFILFTTRNRQLANRLVGPNIISVSELDDTLARDLLRNSLVERDRDLMFDQQSGMMLVHYLGNLPLALIQAASYITQNMIGACA